MGFRPKLGTRNLGKRIACNSLGINRLVQREDLKEKEFKNYGREREGEKCQEAKKEEAGRSGERYRNEKRKSLGKIKRRLWAKTFVKHSEEKQDLTVVCKSITQQRGRVDLRAAMRSQRG